MQGRITISRIGNDHKTGKITIRVEDKASSVQFVELEMNLADFAIALTGRAISPVDFELKGTHLVGKQLENRTVNVAISVLINAESRAKAIRKAIAEYEGDGWVGSDNDALNFHNRVDKGEKRKTDIFRVHYHRYTGQSAVSK